MKLYDQITRWVDGHRDEFLRDTARLVAIKSVAGEPEEGKPFGPGPFAALEEALRMCADYGFTVNNYDGYVGTADIGCVSDGDTEQNAGPAILDILCHLDIVGEGAGWDTDPYVAVEKDGCFYGRGTDDDKGPLVASLYAMRAVRELGLPVKGRVRLIMGTDEESGSSDLRYYYAREKAAPGTFSPDASFPVYNTEKGRYAPEFTKSWDKSVVLPRASSFEGGFRINVLPADASAAVLGLGQDQVKAVCAPLADKMGVRLTLEDMPGGVKLSVSGTGSHASLPEEGNNGLTALLALLTALPLGDCPSTKALRQLAELFPHGDSAGVAAGIAAEDEVSGKLTLAFSLLHLDETGLRGSFDSRVPVCSNEENCSRVIEKRMGDLGFSISGKMSAPHHTPADSPFVQTLLRSYERYSGRKGECLAMGGGTYVHDVEGGVAFGAGMPGFVSNMHGANERMNIADMLTACKIFAQVIADKAADVAATATMAYGG